MKKILVTGGAGFIGSAIVHALVKQNNSIRVLDNESRGKFKRLGDIEGKVEFIHADICDSREVQKACKGVDSVVHLAAINGTQFFYSNPDLVLEVGIKGILNIIDASKKGNIKELFFASSSEVYQTPPITPTPENIPLSIPDPYNPRYSYAGSKIISELLIIHNAHKYIKRLIIFRPHNVYGPDMGREHVIPQFILRMQNLSKPDKKITKFLIQGTGNETRTFIYIDDFIRAFLLLMKKGKNLEIYNIGSQNEISIKQLVKKIAKNFNKSILIIPGKISKGSTPRRYPTINKLKRLGFRTEMSLSDGLKRTIKWYNNIYNQ